MSSLSLSSMSFTDAEARVHHSRLFHDQPICVELANILAGIRIADFRGLVGVEPDFAFAAAENLGGECFLRAEVWHR